MLLFAFVGSVDRSRSHRHRAVPTACEESQRYQCRRVSSSASFSRPTWYAMAVGSNSLPVRAPIFTRISVVAERKITVQSLVGRRSSARGSGSTYTRSVHEIRHQELLAGKVCTARTQIHGREQRAASLTLMRGCRACDFCVLEHWYRDSKNNYIVVWWPLFRYCETRDNDLVLLSALRF